MSATTMRIDEATPDTNVTGVELLPVSDNGTGKSASVNDIKNFVLAKIYQVAAGGTIDTTNDCVLINQLTGAALKQVGFNAVFQAMLGMAFSQTEYDPSTETALAGTELLIMRKGTADRRVKLSDLATYIRTAVAALNFNALTARTDALADTVVLAAQDAATATVTNPEVKKVTLQTIKEFILAALPNAGADSTAALGSTDKLFAVDGTTGNVKKVTIANAGLGTGTVTGPADATTVGNIPTWAATNGKTLATGLAVTSSVTSSSQSTEIPTAAAVNAAIASAVSESGGVTGPASSTDGNIPAWNGTDGSALKAGYGVSTSVSATPSDSKVLTEKATADAIDAAVDGLGDVSGPTIAAGSTVLGQVPTWGDTGGRSLAGGMAVTSTVSAQSTSTQLPTAAAVNTAISAAVASKGDVNGPAITEGGAVSTNKIAQFSDATGKQLKSDLGVDTTIDDNSATDTKLPTSKAVKNYVASKTADMGNVKTGVDNEIGYIPRWASDGSGGMYTQRLSEGMKLCEEIDSVQEWSTANHALPSCKAVSQLVGTATNGMVVGPTNVIGHLAKWGNVGGTIADGPAVATSIAATPTNSEIPTAKAVSDAIAAVKTTTPPTVAIGASVDNEIARFDGNNGTALKAGLSFSTTVSSSSTDAQVPSAKAVNDAIVSRGGNVVAPTGSVDVTGLVPKFINSTGTQLGTFSISTGTSSNGTIPTLGKVNNLISDAVAFGAVGRSDNTVHEGHVSIWRYDTSGHTWCIGDGPDIVTSIAEPSVSYSEQYLPTVNFVKKIVNYVLKHSGVIPRVVDSETDLDSESPDYPGVLFAMVKDAGRLYFRESAAKPWFKVQGTQL